MDRPAGRRDRLRRLVRQQGADAILVTNFVNVTYLTGFTGDDSYLLVTDKHDILMSDPRYTTQLQEECPGVPIEIRQPGTEMITAVTTNVKATNSRNLAIEADSMTVRLFAELDQQLRDTKLLASNGIVEQLRLIKDKQEIDEIRVSVEQAEKALRVITAGLTLSQTEKEVAANIEDQIRRFGGRGCSFPPIVAVGPRAALPHANPTGRRIGENDFVLIDWGAFGNLYASDLTRVFVTGKISPKLERIYDLVLKAQRRAISSIRPGISMEKVDSVARRVIEAGGHGKHFGHGLGHGLGLEIHEAPRLAKGRKERLKAGMVVTVEPGIYLPHWGGVRIEDDVLVTRDGHEVLTSFPKELAECVLS